ncbi:hypothetical protein [Xanthobacter flavus]|uniref:hypothetical protein n=1 Tax=Xanthobacter flavus TaxID=281 RepID=UPI00372B0B4E
MTKLLPYPVIILVLLTGFASGLLTHEFVGGGKWVELIGSIVTATAAYVAYRSAVPLILEARKQSAAQTISSISNIFNDNNKTINSLRSLRGTMNDIIKLNAIKDVEIFRERVPEILDSLLLNIAENQLYIANYNVNAIFGTNQLAILTHSLIKLSGKDIFNQLDPNRLIQIGPIDDPRDGLFAAGIIIDNIDSRINILNEENAGLCRIAEQCRLLIGPPVEH